MNQWQFVYVVVPSELLVQLIEAGVIGNGICIGAGFIAL